IAATAVPLNYRLTPEEATYVVDNSDAVLVWVDAEFADLINGIRKDTPKVRDVLVYDGGDGDGIVAGAADAEPALPPADEPAATMIYTSGTTGHPKGALRRGAGDPAQTAALIQLIGYRPDDIYLTTGPLYHSGPGGFLGAAHALSNTAVLQRKFDPED